ncbi:hypothetical protein Esi_0321_0018 [Ectocarpus siliculosus]|uniref:Uncharacterized protein n=1 Tax=Ectocarpus siliculosus TaxID=2880 RepID=D8LL42_ECTSI|nr:hypothetical protein Esi_0321_0018 [Ectocarpus siliculosus]|eukprot:CBN79659.1 hypothetical protein Esi_0321_0018 [Ectocarpus siliculosus]
MVISLTTRKHIDSQRTDPNPSALASPAKDVSLLFDLMPDFVSEEEAARFETLEEGSGEGLRRDARELTLVLARCFRLPRLDSSSENKINRQTLKRSFGRRVTAFKEAIAHGSRHFEPNPSNTAVLAPPGYGEQPFLSVSGTETVFSLQTWRDWLGGETEAGDNADDDGQEKVAGGGNQGARGGKQKAKHGQQRVLASYVAFFIVDWFLEPLMKKHGLPPRTERFRGLIAAVRGGGHNTNMDEILGGIKFRSFNFLDKERIEILRNTAGAGAKAGAKAAGAAPGNDDDQDEAGTSRTRRSRRRTPPRAGKAARRKQMASADVLKARTGSAAPGTMTRWPQKNKTTRRWTRTGGERPPRKGARRGVPP